MAKRCDHCIYFLPTVFDGETDSGYGNWNGYCQAQPSEDYGWLSPKRVKSLYYACDKYFAEIPELKSGKWKWLCDWSFTDFLEYLRIDFRVLNVTLDLSRL